MFNPLRLLEHHPEHYIQLKLFGRTYHLCSRCTGQYLFFIPSFFLFMLLYFKGYSFDFNLIFFMSWGLALTAILDWATVEILHIRQGSNKTRFLTGGMLGIAIALYLWLLPTTWFIRITTLLAYGLFFTMLMLPVRCKKYNINPLDEINKIKDDFWFYLSNPRLIFCTCNCCPLCWCPGVGGGCTSLLCLLSCCCCPCFICPLLSGNCDIFKSKKR